MLHPSVCQVPDFDPNGDFPFPGFNPFENDFDDDAGLDEFPPLAGNFASEGETTAVLHSETQEIQAKLGSKATLPCQVTNPGSLTVCKTLSPFISVSTILYHTIMTFNSPLRKTRC